MYIAKSALLFSVVALCRMVAAETPACLLSVMGDQPNPADLATICGSSASKVEAAIKSECGDDSQSALKVYSSTCSSAGHAVSIVSATSGATSTDSGSSKSTGTSVVTTTDSSSTSSATSSSSSSGSISDSASGSSSTASSSGSSASTTTVPGAAPSNHAGSAAAFAAAVFVGFAALL